LALLLGSRAMALLRFVSANVSAQPTAAKESLWQPDSLNREAWLEAFLMAADVAHSKGVGRCRI
jgi:hypothetical protein